ncbi:isoaspartyl peptidase/L-asparaginase family protein [Tengunoibacter tsumagoiensis]|uniref:Peptidase T n=1 Tax=Tengunoibacter tsumagoiensis TaxID=2014871 RepID=A0A401ZUV9_9CHLR|nr:isoaspartyl peptidase/L-asparaginase family protein [Tengunoibacter tsumagoiensis]GCE10681.1 peptidase T [Tengunoibacter tsumagoiensis]
MTIALLVHGGAGDIAPEHIAEAQSGCSTAVKIGWQILESGGSALDAVEATVRALEDNPSFNAGTGACLALDGNIELDAGIMDGRSLRVGALAGLELVKNPISVARKILESPHALLIGKGAQQFALEQGITLCRYEELLTERQHQKWLEAREKLNQNTPKHGTVGAVAVDSTGALAAATSTGGILNKYPGRVGDSPLVGCGFYADDYAAVSCTGYGEDFIRLMIARRAAEFVSAGASAQEAADATIAVLSAKAEGDGGLIVVDREGRVGVAHNSPQMAYGYLRSDLREPIAGV